MLYQRLFGERRMSIFLIVHLMQVLEAFPVQPSGQNHADSAGNPQGWWILGGGESPEKFGLSVKRESTGKLRGNLGRDSSRILPRFPEEFVGISMDS